MMGLQQQLQHMATVYARFRSEVEDLVPGGDVDAHQVAANELAWALARTEAATATAEWAEQANDELARDIAAATVAEATSTIEGRSALDTIEQGRLLERIAETYRPLQDVGASHAQRMLRDI